MAIILPPQPWTRQPQSPVGINLAHPFASKALLLVNVNTLVDVTKGQVPTINTPASQSTIVGLPGAGRSFTGSTTAGLLYSGRSTAAIPRTTFVGVFTWAGAGGANFPQLMGTSTQNSGIRVGDGVTGTGSTFGITKGAVANLGTVTLTANVPYVFIAGHDDSSGVYYTTIRSLIDGTISTVSGTSAGASVGGIGTFAVGISRTDYSGAWNGNVWMGAIFGEYFPEAQATHLLYNPWQLFAPLPRRIFVGPSAGGATPRTATATLDAAIQGARTATATLDAAIRQTNTATSTLDGVIATRNTATTTLDAAIRAGVTATTTLDAAIRAAMSATSTLDAVIQTAGVNTYTATATLDAAIREGKTLTATLDAAIQRANTGTATLDARIVNANTATATLDATIRAAVTAYALLDAYIFDADAPVVEVVTGQTPAGRPSKDKKRDMRRRYVMPDDTIILATPTEAEQLVKLFVKPKPVRSTKQAPKRVVKELKAVDLVEMESVSSDTVPTEKITVKKKAVWDVEADLYVKAMRMMAERELKRRRHEEELILLAA